MRKKQWVCVFLFLGILTATFSACGGQEQSWPSAESSTEILSDVVEEISVIETDPAMPESVWVEESSDVEDISSIAEPEATEPEQTAETVEELAPAVDYSELYPIFDEPESFTIWVANSPDLSDVISDFSDFLVISEMEKLTNLHWDANLVSFTASQETFGLMLASQDYTDVINGAVAGYTGGGDAAVDDDVILDIQDYIPENMPALSDWMDRYPDLRKSMISNDGHICGFPKIQDPFYKAVSSGMVRKDWLDDLGMEVPKTYDDLHNVLLAFRDEKQASAPMQIGAPTGVQDELLAGYNISGLYYQVDGEVRLGALQPEFKDYLNMVHQWYDEKLIDPDFTTNAFGLLLDYTKVLNDQAGVWYTCNLTNIGVLEANAADPNFSALSFSDVSVDGGPVHCARKQNMWNPDAWSITTVCDDPASICKYVDYLYSRDGVVLCNYGVEGYTYEYDADGNRVFTDVMLNNPDYSYSMCLNIYTCDMQTQVPYVLDSRKETSNYNEDQWASYYSSGENADDAYMLPPYLAMTPEESTEYAAIYSDIETYMDENVSKFVTGDKSMEEFDDFVAALKQMNVDRCVELQQTAYDRYMAK